MWLKCSLALVLIAIAYNFSFNFHFSSQRSGTTSTSTTTSVKSTICDSVEECAAIVDADICDIDRIPFANFTTELFLAHYYQFRPFILVDYDINAPEFRQRTSIEALLKRYGEEFITAASANTYSHTKMLMSFSSYVEQVRRSPMSLLNMSDSTAYFFGDHDDPGMFDLNEQEWMEQELAYVARESKENAACNPVHSQNGTAASKAQHDERQKRPIWAHLLRLYHPPTYILPLSQMEASNRQRGNAQKQATSVAGANKASLDAAGQRALFNEGDAASADSTAKAKAHTSPTPSKLPPRHDYARYSFGIAGHRSGVPFHFHGAAIGEVLHGAKRWFLYPPSAAVTTAASTTLSSNKPHTIPFEGFQPDLTQLQWMAQVYPTLKSNEKPMQCTLHPQQLLYVPGNWYHATLNLGEVSVFLSTFVDEGRMEHVMRQSGMSIKKKL